MLLESRTFILNPRQPDLHCNVETRFLNQISSNETERPLPQERPLCWDSERITGGSGRDPSPGRDRSRGDSQTARSAPGHGHQ
jgi:hypothetical protein